MAVVLWVWPSRCSGLLWMFWHVGLGPVTLSALVGYCWLRWRLDRDIDLTFLQSSSGFDGGDEGMDTDA